MVVYPKETNGDTKMSYTTWKNYTKIIPNSAEEREGIAAEREELNEREDYEKSILSWKASNGQLIEVFDIDGLAFSIDGSMYFNCQIAGIPAAQAAKYAAMGIVAVLKSETGMQIGLTAERKAALV